MPHACVKGARAASQKLAAVTVSQAFDQDAPVQEASSQQAEKKRRKTYINSMARVLEYIRQRVLLFAFFFKGPETSSIHRNKTFMYNTFLMLIDC